MANKIQFSVCVDGASVVLEMEAQRDGEEGQQLAVPMDILNARALADSLRHSADLLEDMQGGRARCPNCYGQGWQWSPVIRMTSVEAAERIHEPAKPEPIEKEQKRCERCAGRGYV